MAIKIYGNHIENCGTGISAPSDANLDIGSNRFIACGKAIDLRAPESLLGALGLQPDTPVDVLREVLAFVGEAPREESEVAEKAKSTNLLKWLSAGANAATLTSGLVSLYHHIPQILAALPG